MKSLEDMKKKYEELGEAIKRLEEQEQQPAEWPQDGDKYWVGISDDSGAWYATYTDDRTDAFLKAIGDMHRTKEEAEAYRAFRMNARTVMRDKIQQFVDEYNGGERGYYEVDQDGLILCGGRIYNPFAMKDRKGAELLLEKFGPPNILWACGGRNPSDSDGPEPGGE